MTKPRFLGCLLLLAASLGLPGRVQAQPAPGLITYQGKLTDPQGVPSSGTFTIAFRIYDQPAGGNLLWSESHVVVVAADGVISEILGAQTPLVPAVFNGGAQYIALQVDNDAEMAPRTRLVSVPYAVHASNADLLDGHDAQEFFDAVQTEKTARTSADSALQQSLGQEQAARTAVDQNLSFQIVQVSIDLGVEKAQRIASDNALAAQINNVSTALNAALTVEQQQRAAGDVALASQIGVLAGDVANEASARAAGDNALQANITTVETSLTALQNTVASQGNRITAIEQSPPGINFTHELFQVNGACPGGGSLVIDQSFGCNVTSEWYTTSCTWGGGFWPFLLWDHVCTSGTEVVGLFGEDIGGCCSGDLFGVCIDPGALCRHTSTTAAYNTSLGFLVTKK